MHEPGVKPDIKEEWKKAPMDEKLVIVLSSAASAMLIIVGTLILLVGQFDEANYNEFFRILTASVVMGVALIWMRNCSHVVQEKRRDRRLKEGLRSKWDDEDHDALEERVKALEEKIGRD